MLAAFLRVARSASPNQGEMRSVYLCVPEKVLFLMPEVPFDVAVGAAFPPTPLRKTAFDSPTLLLKSYGLPALRPEGHCGKLPYGVIL